jgi:hypothetical protein
MEQREDRRMNAIDDFPEDRFPPSGARGHPIEGLRLPPHSAEAEQAVLGILLTHNDGLDGLEIAEHHFYRHDHRLIWNAAHLLIREGGRADPITVMEALRHDHTLDEAGGAGYLHQLSMQAPPAANAGAYARIVVSRAKQRKLAELGTLLADGAYSPGANVDNLVAQHLEALARGGEAGAAPGHALPGFTPEAAWEPAEPVSYLMRNVVVEGGITTVYGVSGALKTVISVAIAYSIGSGRPLFGMATKRAGVLYVCGEAHAGMKNRVRAWLMDNGFRPDDEDQPWVYVTTAGADLMGNPGQIRATLAHAEKALDTPIGLIVLDTLTANAGAADLNDARDASAVIMAAKARTDIALLQVHHVGQNQHERERGSYQIIGGADVRLQAIYDEPNRALELIWQKLKDDEKPEPLLLRPHVVRLGTNDEDGREITSVTLRTFDGAQPARQPTSQGLGKNQETGMKVLKSLLAKARKNLQDRGDDPDKACITTQGWRQELEKKGLRRNRINDVVRDLQKRELITFDGPHIFPTGPAGTRPEAVTNISPENTKNTRPECDRNATGTGHEKRPECTPTGSSMNFTGHSGRPETGTDSDQETGRPIPVASEQSTGHGLGLWPKGRSGPVLIRGRLTTESDQPQTEHQDSPPASQPFEHHDDPPADLAPVHDLAPIPEHEPEKPDENLFHVEQHGVSDDETTEKDRRPDDPEW